MPRAIVLNPADNVATLLDAGQAGDACALEGERTGKLVLLQASRSATRCASPTPRRARKSSSTARSSAAPATRSALANICMFTTSSRRVRAATCTRAKTDANHLSRIPARKRRGRRAQLGRRGLGHGQLQPGHAHHCAHRGRLHPGHHAVRARAVRRDLDFAFESLAGLGRNPNIAAVLLVGLEPSSTEEVRAASRPRANPSSVYTCSPTAPSIALRKARARPRSFRSKRRARAACLARCRRW